MVRVPFRLEVPVFAAYEYVTVPLPVPFAPPVIVSHDEALLEAFQVQLDEDAVTLTLPVPPAAIPEGLLVGDIL